METWLSLNEYANRHQISVSTLRRRIKSNKIEYKLEDGKYFISEDGDQVPTQPQNSAPKQSIAEGGKVVGESFSTTRLLLDELKKAYLDSLQSKEDQILYLKQQVSDLQTLVMFLEKENGRLKIRGR